MKRLFILLIAISFASIAVFGFLAMSHDSMDNSGCLASTAEGALCPTTNPFIIAFFHQNAFAKFGTALLVENLTLLFSILVALFAVLTIWGTGFKLQKQELTGLFNFKSLSVQYNSFARKIAYWLTLLRNSPALGF
jgi:hypothetical protein